ncbi:DNA-binding protein [Niabella ginsenosidivorans]|uniref:DNA-binding protein n=1 Tax=Niabella ginsenosidivorans TaxID=1176587 RepID=A0A1A9I6F2_9BACT|nr:helix-hairpin-helix domain-containing protein [Niabella ginsenosidivorans]ANH82271.1 DNA-binding protein [Niabella ginsenosidivorans]
MKKTVWKEYLQFSRKEQLGLLVLVIIIFVFAVFPFIPFQQNPEAAIGKQEDTMLHKALITLDEKKEQQQNYDQENDAVSYYQKDPRTNAYAAFNGHLFRFDPNTLDKNGWKELGLRDRTIQTIINYRNKGGRFRRPDDLQKIYGLHQNEFERLKPYIVISGQELSSQRTDNAYPERPDAQRHPQRKAIAPIDINQADTAAFISLSGIGSRLAARIVNFRDKLGGFYSIDQIGETYGVPDSTFQKIKPWLRLGTFPVKKLNINTAAYEELNAHPYISSKLAYLISKQRRLAPVTTMEALKALVAQTNDAFEKLAPYVRFD